MSIYLFLIIFFRTIFLRNLHFVTILPSLVRRRIIDFGALHFICIECGKKSGEFGALDVSSIPKKHMNINNTKLMKTNFVNLISEISEKEQSNHS